MQRRGAATAGLAFASGMLRIAQFAERSSAVAVWLFTEDPAIRKRMLSALKLRRKLKRKVLDRPTPPSPEHK
jgi:hypothetical protein